MKDLTILSTACGAMFMPGFFNCLKENGERNIKIIGVDMADNPFMDNLLDGYYQVPTYTDDNYVDCLLYTSPSPRDRSVSRMPSSA